MSGDSAPVLCGVSAPHFLLGVMREYAPFFEWFDKGRKELGVVEDLVESLKASGVADWRKPRLQHPDPPDCVCVNAFGQFVAVEVVEAVSEEAAELTAKGHSVYRRWNAGEFGSHVARLLRKKDQKTYHGGPYAETVACIFTDEPMLTFDQAAAELIQASFGPFTQLTGAFLLFSYSPHTKSYPVIPIKFVK
jgi:hypothetical protein